ncbi:cellulase family glycosylhydrolase [Microbacterium sp. NPDC019599]|uniref:glycoside hydrolase family 5 protein n=1 Tax=Microbacterium sp. NPDC019599 TaxID=3154690 RepID=UPI0033F2414B
MSPSDDELPDIDPWESVAVRGLRRGVNLSHWYAQVYTGPGYVAEHFDTAMTRSDLELIVSMGFDHVRFPFAFEQVTSTAGDAAEFIARLRREVERLHALGLAVVVDAHPELALRDALAKDAAARTAFVADWRRVAGALADLPTETTAFEILNEPSLGDARVWEEIVERALEALTSAAPQHSVVVSGDGYSDVAELLHLDPSVLRENVVLNLHHYEPVAISHQSAYFTPPDTRDIKGLEYPVEGANVRELLAGTLAPEARARVKEFVRAGWSRGSFDAVFAAARVFAGARPLTCNEFGVYRGAPRGTRLRWTRDAVAAMEAQGIGWTVWDYGGDFAVTTRVSGIREPDLGMLVALGLRQEDTGA